MNRLQATASVLALSLMTGCRGVETTEDIPEPPEPFEPVCCGCLCVDSSWSCAADTCIDAAGEALVAPEAGFLELPARDYELRGESHQLDIRRIWYAFHPADAEPEAKPLFVFFNGLDTATTAVLFAFNTGPLTMGNAEFVEGPSPNPHSWTALGNALWLDTGFGGYSYALTDREPVSRSLPQEGADAILLVLGFLRRHPEIRANDVIVVAESWGGARANNMLYGLRHFDELAHGTALRAFRDPAVHAGIDEHYTATGRGPAQFGRLVLIQGLVGAGEWVKRALAGTCDAMVPWCPPDDDSYFEGSVAAAEAVTKPSTLSAMTGVDVTTVAWLDADARGSAYHPWRNDLDIETPELDATFGELGEWDRYFVRSNFPTVEGESAFMDTTYSIAPIDIRFVDGPASLGPLGLEFLDNLTEVEIFMTHAGCDSLVRTSLIPCGLSSGYPEVVAAAELDPALPAQAERPGVLRVSYHDPAIGSRTARVPYYPNATHQVTRSAAAELRADIEAWLLTGE